MRPIHKQATGRLADANIQECVGFMAWGQRLIWQEPAEVLKPVSGVIHKPLFMRSEFRAAVTSVLGETPEILSPCRFPLPRKLKWNEGGR